MPAIAVLYVLPKNEIQGLSARRIAPVAVIFLPGDASKLRLEYRVQTWTLKFSSFAGPQALFD
jgi:hypothetical protein